MNNLIQAARAHAAAQLQAAEASGNLTAITDARDAQQRIEAQAGHLAQALKILEGFSSDVDAMRVDPGTVLADEDMAPNYCFGMPTFEITGDSDIVVEWPNLAIEADRAKSLLVDIAAADTRTS